MLRRWIAIHKQFKDRADELERDMADPCLALNFSGRKRRFSLTLVELSRELEKRVEKKIRECKVNERNG